MKNIGFIGNLGNENSIGGQITKTRELLRALVEHQGMNGDNIIEEWIRERKSIKNVRIIDVAKNRNPLLLCIRLYELIRKSDYVVVILASKGYFFLLPLIIFFNSFFNKPIYEFVIGGIRYELLNTRRIAYEKRIERIYVESTFMVEQYKKIGLNNVTYMPNFKKIRTISEKEIADRDNRQLRICTFSRIDRYKGIDIAVEIMRIIEEADHNIYLDIFGPIDKDYEEDFEKLLKCNNCNINYKGTIENKNAIEVLKNYDILLFPTRWKTEGFPGSFIDAMAAGLVIMASERENFHNIVECENNGFLFDESNIQLFIDKILFFSSHKEQLRMMQKNALKKSRMYNSDYVLKNFFDEIEKVHTYNK